MMVFLSQFDKSAKEWTAIFTRPHQSAGQIRDIVENSMIARAGSSKVAIIWSLQNLSMDLGHNIFPPGFKVWKNLDVKMWLKLWFYEIGVNFGMSPRTFLILWTFLQDGIFQFG